MYVSQFWLGPLRRSSEVTSALTTFASRIPRSTDLTAVHLRRCADVAALVRRLADERIAGRDTQSGHRFRARLDDVPGYQASTTCFERPLSSFLRRVEDALLHF